MPIKHVTFDQWEEWNAFAVREPSFALLQSWEWGEFKEKLGWKVFRIAVQEQGRIIAGAQMLIKPLPLGGVSIAYIPRGPIGNWLDKQIAPQLLSELHQVARLHKAIYLKIEPPILYNPAIDQILQHHHFYPSSFTNQPRATIIMDLRPSLDDILRQMRKTTRQSIKYSTHKGVSIREGCLHDLPTFYDLMRITGRRQRFTSRTRTYYEQEWRSFASTRQNVLLKAAYQDRLLAMHMAYSFGDRAAYFHGGSLIDHAKLYPNHLLVWEAIKWAKERGSITYDLWGIPDEVGQFAYERKELPRSNRKDGLWGVFRFKSGFSKNVVYYLGAYDYIYNPILYMLLTNRLINMETMDRFSALMDTSACN